MLLTDIRSKRNLPLVTQGDQEESEESSYWRSRRSGGVRGVFLLVVNVQHKCVPEYCWKRSKRCLPIVYHDQEQHESSTFTQENEEQKEFSTCYFRR